MGTAELTDKIESLSADDYNMVIMLVNRLTEKSDMNDLQRLSEDQLVEEMTESITQTSHPKSGHNACINVGWDTNQLIS